MQNPHNKVVLNYSDDVRTYRGYLMHIHWYHLDPFSQVQIVVSTFVFGSLLDRLEHIQHQYLSDVMAKIILSLSLRV